jgi:hypothetical protein
MELLLKGDYKAAAAIQECGSSLSFLQFPSFKLEDLVTCLVYKREEEIFNGPMAPNDFKFKDYTSRSLGNVRDTLLLCAELLEGPSLQSQLQEMNENSWKSKLSLNSCKTGIIIRELQLLSDNINNSLIKPTWIPSLTIDQESLKKTIVNNVRYVILRKRFHSEYDKAVEQQNEWIEHQRLSILFILLCAESYYIERITKKSSRLSNNDFKSEFRNFLLGISLSKRSFGYRISNFLECPLIEDEAASVAAEISSNLLDLLQNKEVAVISQWIFEALKEFVQKILEKENIKIGESPIYNLRAAFFFPIIDQLKSDEKGEELQIKQELDKCVCDLCNCIQDLLKDIENWNYDCGSYSSNSPLTEDILGEICVNVVNVSELLHGSTIDKEKAILSLSIHKKELKLLSFSTWFDHYKYIPGILDNGCLDLYLSGK